MVPRGLLVHEIWRIFLGISCDYLRLPSPVKTFRVNNFWAFDACEHHIST